MLAQTFWVLLLSFGIYWYVSFPPIDEEVYVMKIPISLFRVKTNNIYFSYSYDAARKAFLSRARALEEQRNSSTVSLHSLPIELKGRDGEELATDILWLGLLVFCYPTDEIQAAEIQREFSSTHLGYMGLKDMLEAPCRAKFLTIFWRILCRQKMT